MATINDLFSIIDFEFIEMLEDYLIDYLDIPNNQMVISCFNSGILYSFNDAPIKTPYCSIYKYDTRASTDWQSGCVSIPYYYLYKDGNWFVKSSSENRLISFGSITYRITLYKSIGDHMKTTNNNKDPDLIEFNMESDNYIKSAMDRISLRYNINVLDKTTPGEASLYGIYCVSKEITLK